MGYFFDTKFCLPRRQFMSVPYHPQFFRLFCCQAHGHYHILSRHSGVSQPCWSRAALVGLARDLKMTLPDDLSEGDRQAASVDLAAIMSTIDALARRRNRIKGKFAPGFVLPHDWQPGEHAVISPWQRFWRGETAAMSFPANEVCGGIMVPLFCDFVGRDVVPPKGRSFRDAEWATYAEAPARIVTMAELGLAA
jgi:hypothetical protein